MSTRRAQSHAVSAATGAGSAQTVVLIGGSAGIGLETARRARAEGAEVVLTGRNPERLQLRRASVDARSTAAFDATDSGRARAVLRRTCRTRSTT